MCPRRRRRLFARRNRAAIPACAAPRGASPGARRNLRLGTPPQEGSAAEPPRRALEASRTRLDPSGSPSPTPQPRPASPSRAGGTERAVTPREPRRLFVPRTNPGREPTTHPPNRRSRPTHRASATRRRARGAWHASRVGRVPPPPGGVARACRCTTRAGCSAPKSKLWMNRRSLLAFRQRRRARWSSAPRAASPSVSRTMSSPRTHRLGQSRVSRCPDTARSRPTWTGRPRRWPPCGAQGPPTRASRVPRRPRRARRGWGAS
mmetsp:Transcript_4454/g.20221  ORF Transcript_4454/g.20221 Transcript_4454/m.20221 type:complete len:263 (-) Transcript_4454:510-1298(-)